MESKKVIISVYPFAYNKILGGQRKIDIRPYTKGLHQLRVGDTIEYVNLETKSAISREVKGIALFDNFDTLINLLDPQMIGYSNREEIRLRIERMYSRREQCEFGVCALFIEEPSIKRMMKINRLERSA
ncbi:MAG: hypothetical protein J6B00_01125 [Alphaproteobacteria bacterium]|nr:hypothetical protein [Alphaproteobacteria bacterium]MBP3688170.1 hypothetical protein [Alphaproteobacteria bacterium]